MISGKNDYPYTYVRVCILIIIISCKKESPNRTINLYNVFKYTYTVANVYCNLNNIHKINNAEVTINCY